MQKDLDYIEAALPELETYLLSNELYYSLGAHLPRLTLGGLLLATARLGLRAETFRARTESLQARWRSAWEAKTAREIQARSRSWLEYLAEYQQDRRSGARLYPQHVRYRAMLTLLGQPAHEADVLVRSVFTAGNFVWEAECAHNFSTESFWYLFGTLKE